MTEELKQMIHNTVIDAKKKMTPGEVEKAATSDAGIDTKTVKLAIKDLVCAGKLRYTYVHGTSFLEPSFDRPVRVSKRIVLKPPDKAYEPRPGEVVVNIAGGTAFGNGAHPTTCLALKALDDALRDNSGLQPTRPFRGLDIGTGTGVLAIALARLGFEDVVGTDIDPCAISEARHNVSLNGLSDRITISDTPVESLKETYAVILANLAYPTLQEMSPLLAARLNRDGVLILTGFKEYASADLAEAFAAQGIMLVREELDRKWACLVLRKPEYHG